MPVGLKEILCLLQHLGVPEQILIAAFIQVAKTVTIKMAGITRVLLTLAVLEIKNAHVRIKITEIILARGLHVHIQ